MSVRRLAMSASVLVALLYQAESANSQAVTITQAKAVAGNVTPGDTPGFPVTISRGGSYVLGTSLLVPSGKSGIVINARGVDLDLRGFALEAVSGSSFGHGIESSYHSRIHNGLISSFKLNGIWVRGDSNVIEGMRINQNGANGIDANPRFFTVVRNSSISNNGASGVAVGVMARVDNNQIADNGTFGLLCVSSCHATGNTIVYNRGAGVRALTGYLVGNYIFANTREGVADIDAADVGMANNYVQRNNEAGKEQIVGGLDVHPNRCVGVPC